MIPGSSTLAVYLLAVVVLLVTPGPAVIYIVARSLDQGRRAGLVSALGIAAGTLFHVAAASLGVSAILLSSALAFSLVKYGGAAYLIWLGLRTILSKEENGTIPVRRQETLRRAFGQGVLVNLLNPKTALFFFAFLPQFADPARGSVASQVFFLGMLFIVVAMISDGIYALLAGTVGGWLRGHQGFLRSRRYLTGSVYVALGVATALAGTGRED